MAHQRGWRVGVGAPTRGAGGLSSAMARLGFFLILGGEHRQHRGALRRVLADVARHRKLMRTTSHRLALGPQRPQPALHLREMPATFQLMRRKRPRQPQQSSRNRIMIISRKPPRKPTRSGVWELLPLMRQLHPNPLQMNIRIHPHRHKPRQQMPVTPAHRQLHHLHPMKAQRPRENPTRHCSQFDCNKYSVPRHLLPTALKQPIVIPRWWRKPIIPLHMLLMPPRAKPARITRQPSAKRVPHAMEPIVPRLCRIHVADNKR